MRRKEKVSLYPFARSIKDRINTLAPSAHEQLNWNYKTVQISFNSYIASKYLSKNSKGNTIKLKLSTARLFL